MGEFNVTECVGVLIDAVSIQRYIFSSNSLKQNIGASHLVEWVFDEQLAISLKKVFGEDVNVNQWKDDVETIQIFKNEMTKVEVGYSGGGNALLLFKNNHDAINFVRQWTKDLLVAAPQLRTAVAIGEIKIDNFQESLNTLYKQLTKNKNSFFPNVDLHKESIVVEDSNTGFVVTAYDENEGFISADSYTKTIGAELAQTYLLNRYKDVLKNTYTFTREISSLGQVEGNSHIAIVHIDGNNIGERFKSCKTLAERRNLSILIEKIVNQSFQELLHYIIEDQMSYLKDKKSGFDIKEENGKKFLPIRPLILGGDDLTFVCDGRLGMIYAERLMKSMYENSKQYSAFKNNPLTSCAGVAITKTKYPFYRAYELSENLCSLAKDKAREHGGSWIDFHITYGGFSGELSEIRNKHYKLINGEQLHFGPYQLSSNDEKSLLNLKKGMIEFVEQWPTSKIKELRSALASGREVSEAFLKDLKAKGYELPKIIGSIDYSDNGWVDNETPYFDMIELIDFYPIQFLKEELLIERTEN